MFFYIHKSLLFNFIEPLKPIIDYTLRNSINLNQIKESDFKVYDRRYVLEWKKSPYYTQIFLDAILDYKQELFMYIQGYYRAFMKQKNIEEFPVILYKG